MTAKELAVLEKNDPTITEQFTVGIYNANKTRIEFDIQTILNFIANCGYGRQKD